MFKNNYPQVYRELHTKKIGFYKILCPTENKIRKKGLTPNQVVLYRVTPDTENYLIVECITKASWATLSPVLKDRFLDLWEGFGVACPSGVWPAAPGQDSKNFSKGMPRILLHPSYVCHSVLERKFSEL